MSNFVRTIAITGGIGAVIAGVLALPAVWPAVAAEQTLQPLQALVNPTEPLFPELFDPDSLVKFDVAIGAGVSTKVTSTQTVKKIAYGNESVVSILHTQTGVYSTDAVGSPYILYPGIEVTPKPGIEALSDALNEAGVLDWTPIYKGSFVLLLGNSQI